MPYIENPKTKGSGIICAIPQKGKCPHECTDCYFQSGRSYLEPIDENTPNIPPIEECIGRIVRINDGNDSNNDIDTVLKYAYMLAETRVDFFFNTSIPLDLERLPGPVVLTVNPGKLTDEMYWILDKIPRNLMFVRVRVNTWNRKVVNNAIHFYTSKDIPVVLTFMRYYIDADKIPIDHRGAYIEKKHVMNTYQVITPIACKLIVQRYEDNPLVLQCGREGISSACSLCGTCIGLYYRCKEQMRTQGGT